MGPPLQVINYLYDCSLVLAHNQDTARGVAAHLLRGGTQEGRPDSGKAGVAHQHQVEPAFFGRR